MGITAFFARRWTLTALFAIALCGCGGPDGGARGVVFRLIDEDPEEHFDRALMVSTEEVARWSFRHASDIEGWTLDLDPEEVSVSSGGLILRPSRQFLTMSREVELDAAIVDAFELRIKGLPRHPVTVEWAGEGESYSNDRKITLEHGRKGPGGFLDHRIVTAGHPMWRGTITRLRFSLTLSKAKRATIDHIAALTELVSEENLAAAVGTAWKLDLGNDVRSGVLSMPEMSVRREMTVPEGAALWLSYALQPRVVGSVGFLVTAVRPDGSRVSLMDEVAAGGEVGWHDAVIDLTGLAGETLSLEFETRWSDGFDPELGLGMWSNPEVVATSDSVRPNVILISIDTLRADHLSLYGYPRETSPHIDAWARAGGIVFDDVVAPAPWTLPSHVSLFTGLDATRHGVNHNRPAPTSLTMLAEPLRRAGYATLAVTGGGFVHPSFGFSQGFDQYWSHDLRMGFEDEIEVEVVRACAQLERFAGRPFFLFFHTYEVHNPFRPRQPFLGEFSNHPDDVMVDVENLPQSADDGFLDHRRLALQQDGRTVRPLGYDESQVAVDLYDAGIAYTDSMVARLLRRLSHLGIEGRTLVILTSDHGELFGEHGVVNHVSLYEGNLLVPLIIVDPQRRGFRRVTDQVRLIDVAPTVLDLIGLDPLADVDGVSLTTLLDGGSLPETASRAWSYAAASNYGLSLRDRGLRKYVVRNDPWPHEGPFESLYDLVRDPGEINGRTTPGADLESYRRQVDQMMREAMPGVRVRLAGDVDGLVRADKLFAQRVKTLRPGCGCLRYGPRKEARFTVAPDGVHDLLLEDVGRVLRFTLGTDQRGGPAAEIAVDLDQLRGVAQIVPNGAHWELRFGDSPAPHGVSVWWHGRSPDATADGSVLDEDLRRQLEALGYVD